MRKVVRAITIKDGRLLVLKRVKGKQIYWVFPGGGVEEGESDTEALEREMTEETGFEVKVGEFFANYHFLTSYMDAEENFYLAEIIGGTEGAGHGPEYEHVNEYEGTHEVDWIDLDKLSETDLRPEEVKNKFNQQLVN
ncbi:MAG: NUDIX domain-containing protein [bacterium]|nr:NUDIX domain-containing protein [bacterium]